MLYDAERDLNPEYQGFDLAHPPKIKQADVVLGGYPLQLDTAPSTLRNNLNFYANITDPYGDCACLAYVGDDFLYQARR